MDLDAFLALRGLTVDDLIGKIEDTFGARTGDTILAVGSLAEGIGNKASDIDIFLIRDFEGRPPTDRFRAVTVGECLVDVLIHDVPEIAHILDCLNTWAARPWSVEFDAGFVLEDRIMLHRLGTARCLADRATPDSRPRRPDKGDVMRLKLHFARHRSRTLQTDLVGLRACADWRSMIYAAEELLWHAADALNAVYGLTNPYPKWRNRLLEMTGPHWSGPLAASGISQEAAEFVWRLGHRPKEATEDRAEAYALRIVGFSRAVFLWAESQLLCRSRDRETRPNPIDMPILDLDVDFAVHGDVVFLGRINKATQPVAVPFAMFQAMTDIGLLQDRSRRSPKVDSALSGLLADLLYV
ncbi:hypothetical protein FMN50_13705 [Rhodobacterales bacterium]|nr:hypothetical protein FMN50_13705 [Rhodobacterales bacterium]